MTSALLGLQIVFSGIDCGGGFCCKKVLASA